jgi:hypothetical protein
MKRTRTRHQRGSLTREAHKSGTIWVFRWSEKQADGTRKNHKLIIGSVRELRTESQAWAAVDKLALNMNRPPEQTSYRDVWRDGGSLPEARVGLR